MKLFDIKNKAVFTLLIFGVAFNILWSMRLETRADKLGNIVDQYLDRLMALEDSFPVPLEHFNRTVGSSEMDFLLNSIHMTSDHISLDTKDKKTKFYMNSGTENSVWCSAEGSVLSLEPHHASLTHFNKSGDLIGNVTADSEGIKLHSNQMIRLQLDEMKRIVLKNDGIVLAFDETQAMLDSERFTIHGGLSGAGFYMDMKKGLIEAQKDTSVVRVGSGKLGEGVELGEFDTGTLAITKGKGVGLRAKKSSPMLIRGENDLTVAFDGNISINAKGNINIRSENGQIKINGQEIHLNE